MDRLPPGHTLVTRLSEDIHPQCADRALSTQLCRHKDPTACGGGVWGTGWDG